MSVVYSNRFFGQAGFSGSLMLGPFTGYVAVVRDIDVYHGSALTPVNFTFQGQDGQAIDSWTTPPAFTGGPHTWRGRQVFLPGDTFTIVTNDLFDVTISGYLLSLP